MGKIVVISNQKGGVGKTTTVINLAYELSKLGKRILIVDIDPQANSTSGLGVERNSKNHLYHLLCGHSSILESIYPTEFPNLKIIPGHEDLSGAQVEIAQLTNRESILKNILNQITSDFDFILIDTPPSLSLLTINAFCASQSVLIPIQCEYFALEGMTQLFKTIKQIQTNYNPDIYTEGIVLTMYDSRTKLSKEVVENVVAHFKNYVYQSVIFRNVKISESPSHGLPVGVYASKSLGAIGYQKLALEFLKRQYQ